jgi:hypothetical protein
MGGFVPIHVRTEWFRANLFLHLKLINTIPILMHQMRISTNQVSSVTLRPKKTGNPGEKIVKTVYKKKKPGKKTKQKTNTVPYEIEPNPSKDRAMHEGDNPSFCDVC